jgi:hypothetical protein
VDPRARVVMQRCALDGDGDGYRVRSMCVSHGDWRGSQGQNSKGKTIQTRGNVEAAGV